MKVVGVFCDFVLYVLMWFVGVTSMNRGQGVVVLTAVAVDLL